jgi:DNA helicase MCM8
LELLNEAMHFTPCRMSSAAAGVLQQFYLKLRNHSTGSDGTPITARQLESLVRLVEARARLELREEITKQDALVSYLFLQLKSIIIY